MIDTIHIWIPMAEINDLDMMAEIPIHLSRTVEHIPMGENGSISGNLQNFRVNVSERGVSLKGSLSKYHLGNNFYSLTRAQTYLAIESLSDTLRLPVKRGKVTRLDIAQNIITDHPPKTYYPYIGDLRYFSRLVHSDSITFRNHNRQFAMYDKTRESRNKNKSIPDEFTGKNVFRLEYRCVKNLKRLIKYVPFSVASIWEKSFYQCMESEWKRVYHSINKYRYLPINLMNINKPKDLIDQLAMEGIVYLGGEHKVMEIVEELRLRKAFSNPEYYSRAKQMVRKHRCKPQGGIENDLIAELDRKVDEVDFLE